MSVLELHVSSSGRLWTFLEAGVVSLELVNALRNVRRVLLLLLLAVVGVQLVVRVTRELEEASVVSRTAIVLLVCFVVLV